MKMKIGLRTKYQAVSRVSKSAFNTKLQPLRSLEPQPKAESAEKEAAKNSGVHEIRHDGSG